MNATLRFNEALPITGYAFQSYQCVIQSELGSDGDLSLSVVDHTGTRPLGRAHIPSSVHSDPEQLVGLLQQVREEFSHNDYNLQDRSMPSQG